MLYCNPCGTGRGYPINTQVQTHGLCEICGKGGLQNDVSYIAPSSKPEIVTLREALIAERAKHLKAMDDAYPDVGSAWFTPQMARQDAIKQLKNEGLLPANYMEI